MAVLQPRGRRDSRASALSRRNWGVDRDGDVSTASGGLVEHAVLGSSPAGMEPSSYNGSSVRAPGRSFHHRSINAGTGMCSVAWKLPWKPPCAIFTDHSRHCRPRALCIRWASRTNRRAGDIRPVAKYKALAWAHKPSDQFRYIPGPPVARLSRWYFRLLCNCGGRPVSIERRPR